MAARMAVGCACFVLEPEAQNCTGKTALEKPHLKNALKNAGNPPETDI